MTEEWKKTFIDKLPATFGQYYNSFYNAYVQFQEERKEVKKAFLNKQIYVPIDKSNYTRVDGDSIANYSHLLKMAIQLKHQDFFKFLFKSLKNYSTDKNYEELTELWEHCGISNNVEACKLMKEVIPYSYKNLERSYKTGLNGAFVNGNLEAFVWFVQNQGLNYEKKYHSGEMRTIGEVNLFDMEGVTQKQFEILKYCLEHKLLTIKQIYPENILNISLKKLSFEKQAIQQEVLKYFIPLFPNLELLSHMQLSSYSQPVLLTLLQHPDFQRAWEESKQGETVKDITSEVIGFITTQLEKQILNKDCSATKGLKNKIL